MVPGRFAFIIVCHDGIGFEEQTIFVRSFSLMLKWSGTRNVLILKIFFGNYKYDFEYND